MADNDKNLRALKQEQTRSRLLLAGRKLFGTQGFTATAIDELAREAAISRAGFFNYFPSKEALLADILAAMDERMASLLEKASESESSNLSGAINRFLVAAARDIEETRKLSPNLLQEYIRLINHAEWQQHTTRQLRSALVALQGDNPAFTTETLLACYCGTLLLWQIDPSIGIEQRFGDIADLFQRAMQA